jgi:hypothetical protein
MKADEPRDVRHQRWQGPITFSTTHALPQIFAFQPPHVLSEPLFSCMSNQGDLLLRPTCMVQTKPRQRVTALSQPHHSPAPSILVSVSLTYHRRYGITGLKVLARQKFAQDLEVHLDSPDFPEACQEAYESTFHTDRGLRDVIIQAFRANPGLSLREDVELAVRETPGLAFELFRMASGLPIAS